MNQVPCRGRNKSKVLITELSSKAYAVSEWQDSLLALECQASILSSYL